MTGQHTKPKTTMPEADRALCETVIGLLKQLQMKINDPDTTDEEMAHIEAALKPGRRLLAYWNSQRSR